MIPRLTLRNLRLFYRSKASVFFSLLSVFLVIALYVLFLGDVWAENYDSVPDVKTLMNTWIVAGLIAITSITSCMGAFGTMVEDKSDRLDRDFLASPVSRRAIVAGYVFSGYIVSVVMSAVAFALGALFIAATGGGLPTAVVCLRVLGIILVTSLMSSSMIFFLVSFFSSNSAFGTASTLLGTMIGFLTGIYLPINVLPEGVQWVVRLFPPSHAAALLRQALMEGAISRSFAGAPAQFPEAFREAMGVTLNIGSFVMTPTLHLLLLLGTALLFFTLGVFVISRKRR